MNYISSLITFLIIPFLSLPLASQSVDDRVVLISVTSEKHDYASPWQKGEIVRSSITGCVIEGKRIVTAAYSLSDHVLIEAMKRGESRKYQASVVIIDYHMGLAILTVQDNTFFDGLKPVEFQPAGTMTARNARVYKWDALSSLKEYTAELAKTSIRFYEPGCGVLMHQFSTSMNNGGNGEPVFIDGKLAGIATGLSNETKTLYVIGTDVIRRMLKDASSGGYEGLPFFWISGAELQSDSNLREFFGVGRGEGGVLVTEVPAASSGSEVLLANDIILSINNVPLDDSGMYDSPYGKLHYYGLIQMDRFVGDEISMRILRDRKKLNVRFKLKPIPADCCTIQIISYDRDPRYYVYGGLVFQELSNGYLESFGQDWREKADKRLLYYYDNMKSFLQVENAERVVVLSRVLPDPVNRGYQFYRDLVLKRANGILVKDVGHLKKILDSAVSRFIVLEFAGETSVVMDRMEAVRREKDLLKIYNISSPTNLSTR
jgi:hypothetical protein